jgi:hypothetical protein
VHKLWHNNILILCIGLELKVYLHHSRVAKISLDAIHKVVQLKAATAASKLIVMKFTENCKSAVTREGAFLCLISLPALVQCFPFKKGIALRFIRCGTAVRTRTKAIDVVRPWLFQKTVYVHLPESDRLKHEKYKSSDSRNGIEGDGKIYGRHHKATAIQNERVFQQFMDELRGIVGEDKVVMCDQEPEYVEERKGAWKST